MSTIQRRKTLLSIKRMYSKSKAIWFLSIATIKKFSYFWTRYTFDDQEYFLSKVSSQSYLQKKLPSQIHTEPKILLFFLTRHTLYEWMIESVQHKKDNCWCEQTKLKLRYDIYNVLHISASYTWKGLSETSLQSTNSFISLRLNTTAPTQTAIN